MANLKSSGFTLVELVMVLILAGIISSVVMALFSSRSAFSPMLVAQQFASATLLAQQAALAGNPSATVTILQGSDRIVFDIGINQFSLTREGATLFYRLQGQSSFSTVPASGLPVSFDELGRVSAPVPRANIDFKIVGERQFELCLSSLGAVYAGACQ